MGRIKTKRRTFALKRLLASRANQALELDCLFENIERTDSSPKKMEESQFNFYNRSARSVIGNVRAFIENCYRNFPEEERHAIRSRIRSPNDIDFESSIFELILHEALVREGCILTPHPELPNGSDKRPDFSVITSTGDRFYLEATVVSVTSSEENGANGRRARVLDALNSAPHENFLILVTESGSPLGQPNGNQLCRNVHSWLDSLAVEELCSEITSSNYKLPTFQWSDQGWRLKIKAWPLNPQSRGKSTSLIGSGSIPSPKGDATQSIHKNIKKKARKYGDLDAPLVIAVNVLAGGVSEINEDEALLGKKAFVVSGGARSITMERVKPEGAWLGNSGVQGLRCSAAWIFNNLRVSSLAEASSTVYFHPWATNPAPSFLERFTHATVENSDFVRSERVELRQTLGLGAGWPREAS
ncbi:hypothetical protein [Marinobacter sp. LN3S78]|uniref:hypothetical protein n=1 Tax=Marinobacter sp. LN3S78 TaxID=3382300 RepID=UPI00387B9151